MLNREMDDERELKTTYLIVLNFRPDMMKRGV